MPSWELVEPEGNPILMLLEGDGSLLGRDRNGSFSATGSGALRYALADNARFAAAGNTHLQSGGDYLSTSEETDDGVIVTGGTEDGGYIFFTGFIPLEATVGATVDLTIGFDCQLIAGQALNWDCTILSMLADSSGVHGVARERFTPSTVRSRVVIQTTIATAEYFRIQLRRSAWDAVLASGSALFENLTIEVGDTDGSFFDGASLNVRTGGIGVAGAGVAEELVFWIEEATTNFVLNPVRGVNNDSWGAVNGTTERSGEYGLSVGSCGKLTATGANAEEYVFCAAGRNVGASHTMTAVVRNGAAASRSVRLVADGAFIGAGPTVVPAGGLAIVSATWLAAEAAMEVGIRWTDSANGEEFFHLYCGVEEKAYATSPCPLVDSGGTLGTGYTWAGVAHASASTRAVTSVSTPTPGHATTPVGSTVARFNQLFAHDSASPIVVSIGTIGGVERDGYVVAVDSDVITLFSGGSYENILTNPADTTNVWLLAYAGWDDSELTVSHDAGVVASVARLVPYMDTFGGNDIGLGAYFNGAQNLDGYVGPVAVYDRPLTGAELLDVNDTITFDEDLWDVLEPPPDVGGPTGGGPMFSYGFSARPSAGVSVIDRRKKKRHVSLDVIMHPDDERVRRS